MKVLTIVVPVFNEEKTIVQVLEKVLAQAIGAVGRWLHFASWFGRGRRVMALSLTQNQLTVLHINSAPPPARGVFCFPDSHQI